MNDEAEPTEGAHDPRDTPRAKPVRVRASDARMELLRTKGPTMTPEQWESWADFERAEWEPFKEAWLARGFLFAPGGGRDGDSTHLRHLLWGIAVARPNDLGRWVEEAPPGDRRSVVTHVIAEWHFIRDTAVADEREAARQKERDMMEEGSVYRRHHGRMVKIGDMGGPRGD